MNTITKYAVFQKIDKAIDDVFSDIYTEYCITTSGDISPEEVYSIMYCENKLTDIIHEYFLSKIDH